MNERVTPFAMLEQLDSVPWASLPQPEWNRPAAVPDAIRRLAAPASREDARQAYNGFLSAIGNNHAGTYFPVVLHTLPFLGEILRSDHGTAREVTLDILVDLAGSFEPDIEHEVVTSESGTMSFLRQLLFQGLVELTGVIKDLAAQAPEGTPARLLADEVLDLLGEPQGAAKP